MLASLNDSNLPPIDQNAASFYNRYVIDDNYGGLAFEEEGERCAAMLNDPSKKVSYKQREIITQSDFHDEFHLRLRANKLPDDFQGHIISAVIHFAQNTGSNLWNFQNKFEEKCKLLSGDFVDSDMGKDIAKWFIDRDISSE